MLFSELHPRGVLGVVLLTFLASNAHAGYGDGVSAVEKAQLPLFCYRQLGVAGATGPQYGIPEGCGAGMNHYCPGLVRLIRAKKEPDRRKALSLLGSVEADVRYTLDWMKPYPNCPIRGHVEATQAEIKRLKLLWGGGGGGKR